jgi:putative MATE family efflux protein
MLSFTLLSVVDTAMLGRLGAAPLAAAGIASTAYFAIVFSLAGIGMGVQTLTARRFGEMDMVKCGEICRAGLAIALGLGIPLVGLAGPLAGLLAPIFSNDPEIVRMSNVYLNYRLLGALFFLLNWSYRGFYNGLGDTTKQLLYAIVTTAANIILDYILIFGHAGFPKMGIGGASIASSIALGMGTIYLIAASWQHRYRRHCELYRHILHLHRWIGPIVRLSMPVVGQRFMSETSFFLFFMIVSRIGTLELAATNVISSIHHLTIMPAFGVAVATTTFLGQHLGAGRPDEAERYAWEGTKITVYLLCGLGLLFILIPGPVFSIYTSQSNVTSVGRLPLMLFGLTQGFTGIAIVLSNSLQGAGNTRFVMVAELAICGGIYLPITYLVGLRFGGGLLGAWSGEYVYWSLLALAMTWKFRQGTWKGIQI